MGRLSWIHLQLLIRKVVQAGSNRAEGSSNSRGNPDNRQNSGQAAIIRNPRTVQVRPGR